MQIPGWLAKATGANFFAADPIGALAGGAGQGPTIGDAFQGIGHSLAEHGRESFGTPQPQAGPTMRDLAMSFFQGQHPASQGAMTGGGAAANGGSLVARPPTPAAATPGFLPYVAPKPPTMLDLSSAIAALQGRL